MRGRVGALRTNGNGADPSGIDAVARDNRPATV